MERPRLRPIEGYPTNKNGQPYLVLRDPSQLGATATLPSWAVAIVQLFDGELTRDQICVEHQRKYKRPLAREQLDSLIAQLDDALLLDSETFRAHSAKVFAEFGRADVRAPLMAGHTYPSDPRELTAALDGYFARPRGPGKPAKTDAARPRALIVPHIDFGRGGPAYAWAYLPLAASADEPPDLVVVLGTDHVGGEQPYALTRKHFDTPLGRIETDSDLVARLVEEGGGDALFRDEHHHRSEHSIEFQMVWLRYIYGARADAIKALPILCGSFYDFIERGGEPAANKATGKLLGALSAATEGKRVLWIASADLAHVGPRYGDAAPLDGDDRASLEKRDRQTLDPVLRGEAAPFFDAIRQERDQRRVCGLAPIYAMLRAAQPGAGQLAVYAQCPAELGSIVSIASIVYPAAAPAAPPAVPPAPAA